ncbi:MAG: flagellar hook-associated protein FlgK, partial [Bdellovibrionales bacterium]|nr:flagellar hook-associated protein FlgK [Bdellovibrionales bacterium]
KINIKYAENDEGIVTVHAGSTAVLVSGYEAMKLSVQDAHGTNGERPGRAEIYFHPSDDLAPVKITNQINNGKIGGAIEIRDKVIEGLLDKNDELAFTIANEVNKVHIEGVDRYSKPGVLFFDILTNQKDASAQIRLNDSVEKDVGKIVAGYQMGGPGDNRVAHKIAGIQFQGVLNNGSANIDDFYNSLVGEVAVLTKQTNMRKDHHENIVKQLGNIRESISGVSLDEETTKMIEMQKAFDASARVIRTADELFDTVLNIKRY